MFAAAFLVLVVAAVVAGRLPFKVPGAYLLASCVTYVAYFLDKAAALKGRWRTAESTLHVFSLVGGWPGAMLAQRTLRHKTQKRSFQILYWMTVLLNCVAVGWLLSPSGMRLLQAIPEFR